MKYLTIGSLLLAAAAVGAASAEPPPMTPKQEADFQKAIEGRTAGQTQSCVSLRLLRGNKTYGEGVIVFEGQSNSVVYVNRPPYGCPELRWDRALKTRTSTDQLCSNDVVTVVDPRGGMQFGSCSLGDWTPYRK